VHLPSCEEYSNYGTQRYPMRHIARIVEWRSLAPCWR
jgi:hypothetical protein